MEREGQRVDSGRSLKGHLNQPRDPQAWPPPGTPAPWAPGRLEVEAAPGAPGRLEVEAEEQDFPGPSFSSPRY